MWLNQLMLKILMQLQTGFGPIEVAAAMYYYYITDAHCCLISYNYYCYIYLGILEASHLKNYMDYQNRQINQKVESSSQEINGFIIVSNIFLQSVA